MMNSLPKSKRTLAPIVALIAGCAVGTPAASATERFFTYSYEPETMPKAAWEIEQWVTLRAGRNSHVGQDNYHKWEFRTELEYGVTDNYTVSLYVNESYENFRDPATRRHTHDLC